MKKKIYTISLICLPLAVMSQARLKKGDQFYSAYNYAAALDKYEQVSAPNIETERKMAHSYLMTGDLKSSETHYAKINSMPARTATDVWNYIQVLLRNENYTEAQKQMQVYTQLSPNDSRAAEYRNAGDFVNKLKEKQNNFTTMNLDINSNEQDFSPVYYGDKVVFVSSREKVGPVWREWNGNQLHFLDLYTSHIDGNGQLRWMEKFDNIMNKKYHEGPASFTPDGKTMAMTRDNYDQRSNKGTRELQLMVSTLQNGKWSKPVGAPFNSKDYSVGHGSFAADGKTLYFASDMPGGKGGVDIYRTVYENGRWGTPENMRNINTEGDEMFPYVHPSGLLFFSSNGHVGLGGLDIFVAKVNENGSVEKYYNAGVPVNSSGDDFAPVMDADMKTGYFSSNRTGGKGSDDIYYFTMEHPYVFGKTIQGIAKDKNGTILPGTNVVLTDNQGQAVNTAVSDANGKFSFNVDKEELYSLAGKKEKYFDGSNTADTRSDEDVVNADVVLEKDPGMSMYLKVLDKKSQQPLEGVKITLTNNMTGTDVNFVTPAAGDYLEPLNGKKLNDRISYNIKMEKEGYIGKTVTYNQFLDKEGRYDLSQLMDVNLEKIEVGADLAKMISLKPIFFDLNKFTIRKDASEELDKIVEIMNQNPHMEVELGSHTDCRGSMESNMKLSDKRAKASAEYIKSRIVNPERISGKGYGETQLINGCACEGKVKPKCTEAEHQENRRTEFRVLKM